jgi:hypothetical protein
MLSFRAQKHEAREEKARKDWPLRDRDAARSPPEAMQVRLLFDLGILHAIAGIRERVD